VIERYVIFIEIHLELVDKDLAKSECNRDYTATVLEKLKLNETVHRYALCTM